MTESFVPNLGVSLLGNVVDLNRIRLVQKTLAWEAVGVSRRELLKISGWELVRRDGRRIGI